MQELAIFTIWHEKHIIKCTDSDVCRICKKESETTFHILAGCDTLAKKEYLERHNQVAKYIHFEICKAFGLKTENKWHCHQPPEVILEKNFEIVWELPLTTDRPVGANRPDIVIRDKLAKKTLIIDISCPSDVNVYNKKNEKNLKV